LLEDLAKLAGASSVDKGTLSSSSLRRLGKNFSNNFLWRLNLFIWHRNKSGQAMILISYAYFFAE
jgi:hypothetical protein